VNKFWLYPTGVSTALGIVIGCLAANHHPPQAAAQGGSIPLRGGVQQLPEQEGRPLLFSSPSGEIFRIWNRLGGTEPEGGGAVFVASSRDGLEWKTLIQVLPETKGINAMEGNLAVNAAGELAVAYRWVRHVPKAKRIRLIRSSDGGKTWTGPPDNYIDQAWQAFDPRVAWGSGKTLVVAWADERQQARRFRIFARRSPDGGSTWEPEVLLSSSDMIGADYDTAPRLLSDEKGRFWLFWNSSRKRQSAVVLARSDDDGRTWSAAKPLSGQGRSVYGLSVNRAGDRLLAVWEDQRVEGANRVFAAVSKDAGDTWSPATAVDGLPATSRTSAAGPSSVMSPSGEAWVAWYDERNGRADVFISKSPDGGTTWGEAVRVDADAPGTAVSRYPRIALSNNGSLAVVWEDDRKGLEAIYGRILSGGRWSAELKLGETQQPKKAGRVHRVIATPQDAFYAVWEVWDYSLGGGAVKSIEGTVLRVQ
jgi:Neuraminidase (sialidase)